MRRRGIEEVADEEAERTGAKAHPPQLVGEEGGACCGRAARRGPGMSEGPIEVDLLGRRSPRQADDPQLPARVERAFDREVGQLPGSAPLGVAEFHRRAVIEDEVDPGRHLLAPQLHRRGAGASVGLPVDVTRIIAWRVVAMVLKLERAAAAPAGRDAAAAGPTGMAEREAENSRRTFHRRMDLGVVHGLVHGMAHAGRLRCGAAGRARAAATRPSTAASS